jgi:hypothetical protein
MAADGSAAPFLDEVSARAASAADRLLVLEFQTIFDYVTLLRATALAVNPIGSRALLVLAAAVSDFYLPLGEMSTHKIQSRAVRARPLRAATAALRRGNGARRSRGMPMRTCARPGVRLSSRAHASRSWLLTALRRPRALATPVRVVLLRAAGSRCSWSRCPSCSAHSSRR